MGRHGLAVATSSGKNGKVGRTNSTDSIHTAAMPRTAAKIVAPRPNNSGPRESCNDRSRGHATASCGVGVSRESVRRGDLIATAALEHEKSAAFDDQASQPAGGVGAGIDVDPVWPHVGLEDRRVPVDDDLAETVFAEEKVVANPEQVFLALLLKGNARLHSGMDEEEIPAGE